MSVIKKSEWKSWPIVAEATRTSAVVRRDPLTGSAWSWVSSGHRVEIERRPSFDAEEATEQTPWEGIADDDNVQHCELCGVVISHTDKLCSKCALEAKRGNGRANPLRGDVIVGISTQEAK